MNNWYPRPLKKSKSWGPLWSYQLNCNANLAYSPQKWFKWAELQFYLAGTYLQNGPKILIFSTAMSANYFHMRLIPPNLCDLFSPLGN